MKYTTILPAFLFLAASALLPISGYADNCNGGEKPISEVSYNSEVDGADENVDGADENVDGADENVDGDGSDSDVTDEDGSDN